MARYEPKVVLVTGGAGFIGSHFVSMLVSKYPYKVINLDKLDYCSSLRTLAHLESSPNYEFVRGNISSVDLVTFLLQDKKVDTIVHFAAQSHVDLSFDSSLDFTADNVVGTNVLLHCARACNIKRFIHVSTDEIYGTNVDGNPVEEQSIMAPTNPYAATKAAAELLVMAYFRSFQTPVVVTRSNNVYGPHQYPEKVIPKFICQLLRRQPCWIHGDGTHARRFLYIDDVIEAYDRVLHHGEVGQVYNIGTDIEISNLELARLLLRKFGFSEDDKTEDGQSLLCFVEDRRFNDARYVIDSTRMNAIGWQPRISFDEGISRTIEWYKEHANDTWEYIDMALQPHPRKIVHFPRT